MDEERAWPPDEESEPVLANLELEMMVLSCLMANPSLYFGLGELRHDHFAGQRNQILFYVIARLAAAQRPIDPVTVIEELIAAGMLEAAGGTSYVSDLAAANKWGALLRAADMPDHAAVIKSYWMRREIVRVSAELRRAAHYDHKDDPRGAVTVLEGAQQALVDLQRGSMDHEGPHGFERAMSRAVEVAEAAYKRDGALVGVPTGLTVLDEFLGGLVRTDLYILAARPSMGKTALAGACMRNAARASYGCLVFSLEMSEEQLAGRLLADEVRIPTNKLRRGLISQAEFQSLVTAAEQLGRLPVLIDDTPGLSIAQVLMRARMAARMAKIDLIIVDYLQLMVATDERGRRKENRVQELTDITGGLKSLAKELDVPVLVLSQLSRRVEEREDKRPQLADLRESGAIEQDADVVMMLYRENYYLARAEPEKRTGEKEDTFGQRMSAWRQRLHETWHEALVLIPKNRHGPVHKVTLEFDQEYAMFRNTPVKAPAVEDERGFDFDGIEVSVGG